MNSQNQLNFIISKIEDLHTAVLHNCSNGVLNIPSAIVNTLHVDNTGCIWFTIFRPKQYVSEFDRRFPVVLNYYQKGRPFYLNIQGMARMVIDPEEINSLPAEVGTQMSDDKILICVKITSATYHERKLSQPKNPLYQLKDFVFSMFDLKNHLYINFEQQGYMA